MEERGYGSYVAADGSGTVIPFRHPAEHCLSSVLPVCLYMIQCIHDLYAAEGSHPHGRLGAELRRGVQGQGYKTTEMVFIRKTLKALYSLLGQCCHIPSLFSLPLFSRIQVEVLLIALPSLSPKLVAAAMHRSLLVFWTQAPPTLYGALLVPHFASLMTFVRSAIGVAGRRCKGVRDEAEVMKLEAEVRMFATSVLSFVRKLLVGQSRHQLRAFLLQKNAAGLALIRLLSFLADWEDRAVRLECCKLCFDLLPAIAACGRFDREVVDVLCYALVRGAMESSRHGDSADDFARTLALLVGEFIGRNVDLAEFIGSLPNAPGGTCKKLRNPSASLKSRTGLISAALAPMLRAGELPNFVACAVPQKLKPSTRFFLSGAHATPLDLLRVCDA